MRSYVQLVIGLATIIALSHTVIARPQEQALASQPKFLSNIFDGIYGFFKSIIISIFSAIGLEDFITGIFGDQLDDIITLNELLDIAALSSWAANLAADADIPKLLIELASFPCSDIITALENDDQTTKESLLETALTSSTSGDIFEALVDAADVVTAGVGFTTPKSQLATGDIEKLLDVLAALNLVEAGTDSKTENTYDISTAEGIIDKINLSNLADVLGSEGPLHDMMDPFIALTTGTAFSDDVLTLDGNGDPIYDYELLATALSDLPISDICTHVTELNDLYPFTDLNAAIASGDIANSLSKVVEAAFGTFIDSVQTGLES